VLALSFCVFLCYNRLKYFYFHAYHMDTFLKKIQKKWASLKAHHASALLFSSGILAGVLLSIFFSFASVSSSFLGATVFNGGGIQGGINELQKYVKQTDTGIITSGNIVQTIVFLVKIALIIAGVAAFIAFIWAGVLYITSFLNEDNNESAKKIMISAAIGIVLILLAYAIVSFLTTLSFSAP